MGQDLVAKKQGFDFSFTHHSITERLKRQYRNVEEISNKRAQEAEEFWQIPLPVGWNKDELWRIG